MGSGGVTVTGFAVHTILVLVHGVAHQVGEVRPDGEVVIAFLILAVEGDVQGIAVDDAGAGDLVEQVRAVRSSEGGNVGSTDAGRIDAFGEHQIDVIERCVRGDILRHHPRTAVIDVEAAGVRRVADALQVGHSVCVEGIAEIAFSIGKADVKTQCAAVDDVHGSGRGAVVQPQVGSLYRAGVDGFRESQGDGGGGRNKQVAALGRYRRRHDRRSVGRRIQVGAIHLQEIIAGAVTDGDDPHFVAAIAGRGIQQLRIAAIGRAVVVAGQEVAAGIVQFETRIQGVARLAAAVARCESLDSERLPGGRLDRVAVGEVTGRPGDRLFQQTVALAATQLGPIAQIIESIGRSQINGPPRTHFGRSAGCQPANRTQQSGAGVQ